MYPQTLGIDFGTSNTAAGLMVAGKPHLISVEPGQTTLPTSLFFDTTRKVTSYGSVANANLIEGREGRFMRALKSVLGTPLMRERRQIAYESLTLIQAVARFLQTVRERAEAETGLKFQHAVSGRPVVFHTTDKTRNAQAEKDLAEAYQLAGFETVAFMHEPEAAALAAGVLDTGTLGLIVDIGGGTSDFSVFAPEGEGIRILASHGVRVGGTDFDKAISLAHVMPLLGRGGRVRNDMGSGSYIVPNALFQDLASWEKIPFLYTPETKRMAALFHKMALGPELLKRLSDTLDLELGHDIAFAVERGKIQINKPDVFEAGIDLRVLEKDLWAQLNENGLRDVLADHAAKIAECVEATLKMADVPAQKIGTVVFVGGSSLLHVVRETLRGLLPQAQFEQAAAFTAVANGLAMAAEKADAAR
jgi:hypothetical chaperone protein